MIISVVRKPLINNVCENITLHNIGGINIDQTRVGTEGGRTNKGGYQNNFVGGKVEYDKGKGVESDHTPKGRWPANVLISEKDGKVMDKQSGILKSGAMDSIAKGGQHTTYGMMYERRVINSASVGGASRFFKVVKE